MRRLGFTWLPKPEMYTGTKYGKGGLADGFLDLREVPGEKPHESLKFPDYDEVPLGTGTVPKKETNDMSTNSELNDRLTKLENKVAKLANQTQSVPVAAPATVRPKAQTLDQAIEYANQGYANDGVQQRWTGTHPGNLDEANVFASKGAPVGWTSDVVYRIFVLTDLLPTPQEKDAAAASGGGLSGTFTRWDANETEGKKYTTEGWWAEVIRRREASSGTPGGGASGDRG